MRRRLRNATQTGSQLPRTSSLRPQTGSLRPQTVLWGQIRQARWNMACVIGPSRTTVPSTFQHKYHKQHWWGSYYHWSHIGCPKKRDIVPKHVFLGHSFFLYRRKAWMFNEFWCQTKVDHFVQYLQRPENYLHRELLSVLEKRVMG